MTDDPQKRLDRAYSPEEFRRLGHQLVDELSDYLASILKGDGYPVYHGISPEDLEKVLEGGIETRPSADAESVLRESLRYAHHLHHPGYVGHQVAPVLPAAALGDMLLAFLNNGTAIYEMGPAQVLYERRLVRFLCDQVGFGESSDGILTHGGSVGNTTGLLAARQAKAGRDVWGEGQDEKFAFLASAQNHYCVDRAVRMMGWGKAGVGEVEVDEAYRLRPDDLARALRQAQDGGRKVLGVVASCCTTATGSFDPIDPIADFCDEHDLWLHVDGAHGASLLLHPEHKHLLKGIDRADSVVWDLHKMMLLPSLVTGVLYREGRRSYEAFAQEASYLFGGEAPEEQWYNLGQRTMECTKRGLGATAYFLLRIYGTDLFAAYIERQMALAQEFARSVQASDDFELAVWPQANIVCFRAKSTGTLSERNQLQERLRTQVVSTGDFYLVQTTLKGEVFLRVTLIHPLSGIGVLRDLLESLRVAARG